MGQTAKDFLLGEPLPEAGTDSSPHPPRARVPNAPKRADLGCLGNAARMIILCFLLGKGTGRDKSVPQSGFSPQPQMARLELGL